MKLIILFIGLAAVLSFFLWLISDFLFVVSKKHLWNKISKVAMNSTFICILTCLVMAFIKVIFTAIFSQ